jgi:hypothetical protein
MPKNSKNSENSRKGNSFELLDESDGDESITVQTTSTRRRPLKRTQPLELTAPCNTGQLYGGYDISANPDVSGTLYGEQWYPMRVDRAYHEVAVDEMGGSLFGQLNQLASAPILDTSQQYRWKFHEAT